MRLFFIIPDIVHGKLHRFANLVLKRYPRLWRNPIMRDRVINPRLNVQVTFGGTLNLMRHCALARSMGVDTALVTPSGKDTYGPFNIVNVPFASWHDISPDDVCVVPDFCSEIVNRIAGRVIVYLQAPHLLQADFDYQNPRVRLWTDSPFMLEKCQKVFAGKEISIVPNIIDPVMFPFRPQKERESGLVFAFPRKGRDFIKATQVAYSKLGGNYWHFELIDGLPLPELAHEMRRPQVFLASGEVEGCALPPQESMAAGIVVVGKTARGANFSMEHRHTAMVAESPEDAAVCLRELENSELRDHVSRNGYEFIRRYFPDGEPTQFWQNTLRGFC